MYCEKCGSLFDGNDRLCPVCGSRKVRYPRGDDLCFLLEKEALWGEMLADVLGKHQIPFVKQPVLGAGIALRLGQGMERYRFYVRYDQLTEARALTDRLFSNE